MDNLTDTQIQSIYERLTKYIDVADLKGKRRSDIVEALNSRIGAIKAKDKQGAPNNLIRAGFSDRVLEVSTIKQELQPAPDVVVVQEKIVAPKRLPKQVITVNKSVSRETPIKFSRQKVRVRVRGKTRNYAKKNVKITVGTWKGKRAYWVYSIREKQLKTWGVAKIEGNERLEKKP